MIAMQITTLRSAHMSRSGENQECNRILRFLSGEDLALLQPHLERVPLPFRKNLQSANRAIKAVYFIEAGLASVVAGNGNSMRRPADAGVGGVLRLSAP